MFWIGSEVPISAVIHREATMRNKILGTIGILWGGAILASFFVRKIPWDSGGPYAAGAAMGFLFGAVMFATGIYYVRK